MVVHFDKIITNLGVSYFYLTILFARGRQYDLDSKLFTKCNTNMFLQNIAIVIKRAWTINRTIPVQDWQSFSISHTVKIS